MFDLKSVTATDQSVAAFILAHATENPRAILTDIAEALRADGPDPLDPACCRSISLIVGLCYMQEALRTPETDIATISYLVALMADNVGHSVQHGHPLAESLVENANNLGEAYSIVLDWCFALAPVVVPEYVPEWL